jgi:integrase/recombinase XerD
MSAGNTRRRAGKPAQGPRIAGDPADPAGFHALLTAYLAHSEAPGFAAATLKNRRDAVNAFTDWCAERAITRPSEVTLAVLERYQRHVASHRRERDGRPLSHRGQIVRLTPLKGLFAYLAKRRHIGANPAAELELPWGERRLPRGLLTAAQAEAVLAQADPAEGLGLRDRAILEVLYSTGLRRGEVIRLAVDDIDHDRGTVLVRQGKHAKDRIVPSSGRRRRSGRCASR